MSSRLLQSLGFLINWTKSTLSPVQSITYLGFVISSVDMTIYLPKAKVQRVYAVCNNALSQPKMSGRQLASLLGTLESCRLAIWVALLHLRALQILLIQTLRNHQFDHNCPVFLNPQSRAELTWWPTIYPRSTTALFLPHHRISQFSQMLQCKVGVRRVRASALTANGPVRNQSSTSTSWN